MTWFTVLKMPNPFGGNWQTLTGDQYYKMDDKNKRHYHGAMASFYRDQLKRAVTPRKAGQPPPATDDEIRGLRELLRFHSRQRQRFEEKHKAKKEIYYSLDEEQNRQMQKPTYDAVERMPLTTKDMYDNYSREQKIKYWIRLAERLRREYGNTDAVRLSVRMAKRMKNNPNYTAPFEGDKSVYEEYSDANLYRDISEYNSFTDKEKTSYHNRMAHRNSNRRGQTGNKELYNFHARMRRRAVEKLPTYLTPEAEKEAEQ